jgi:protein-L-isoaspartate(D-aspartate) O-methyltransferase
MVEDHIAARGVLDPRILSAMREVPRHLFVPPPYDRAAYQDSPLPIGHGQTISQPYIVAYMTELLQPLPSDNVLEIGAGSGYQAAILGRLVRSVITVERLPDVAELATRNLSGTGVTNVKVVVSDGTLGYRDGAPYDGIIITAATPEIPGPLIDQLAESGRLVAPVGGREIQELVRLTKKGGSVLRQYFGGVRFVPLIGEHGWNR